MWPHDLPVSHTGLSGSENPLSSPLNHSCSCQKKAGQQSTLSPGKLQQTLGVIISPVPTASPSSASRFRQFRQRWWNSSCLSSLCLHHHSLYLQSHVTSNFFTLSSSSRQLYRHTNEQSQHARAVSQLDSWLTGSKSPCGWTYVRTVASRISQSTQFFLHPLMDSWENGRQ